MTRRTLAKNIAPLLLEGADKKELINKLAAYLVIEGRTDEVGLLMNDIALELERLGYSEVQVTSAHSLGNSVKAQLKEIIKAETGAKTVKLNETIDQSLVGGIIATTPSTEIDLSVRGKLKTLGAS